MATTGSRTRLWPLIAVIAVLATVVVALLGFMLATSGDGADQQADEQAAAGSPSPLESLARRTPGDPLALGEPDAPVVMVAYEDFRCPFCAKFSTEIAPELIDRYVETGTLRIEWRDLPIFGEESMLAARAGRAAAEQDMFWPFQDVVYSHAPETGHPSLPESTLVEHAEEAGVEDIDRFKEDLNDPELAEAIHTDAAEGAELGIASVPAFIINGDPVMGAQPLPEFVSAIESAEAAAS